MLPTCGKQKSCMNVGSNRPKHLEFKTFFERIPHGSGCECEIRDRFPERLVYRCGLGPVFRPTLFPGRSTSLFPFSPPIQSSVFAGFFSQSPWAIPSCGHMVFFNVFLEPAANVGQGDHARTPGGPTLTIRGVLKVKNAYPVKERISKRHLAAEVSRPVARRISDSSQFHLLPLASPPSNRIARAQVPQVIF